jgi:hypothetical protein
MRFCREQSMLPALFVGGGNGYERFFDFTLSGRGGCGESAQFLLS